MKNCNRIYKSKYQFNLSIKLHLLWLTINKKKNNLNILILEILLKLFNKAQIIIHKNYRNRNNFQMKNSKEAFINLCH
jgi:hypothetical protein